MIDDDWYDDEPDYGRPKEEPGCGGCNDNDWVKAWGWRWLLARVMPMWMVWGTWRGLVRPWGTLGGSWPCPSCNPMWLDRLTDRFWHWRRQLRKRLWPRPAHAFDDELPF